MDKKYIEYFPKPLLADLVAGRWLPIIGAGMSLNAKVPSGKGMPLWTGLGTALASELSSFEPNGVVDTLSAYEYEFGRARLIERLADILLIGEAQPGEAHKAFCSMSFDIVCTTNFDFLLERQYDLIPHQVYPVVDEEQLSINLSVAGTRLLKLHGDLHHPRRLVVTETDYDSFLASYPLIATYLANQLITKTAIFIGYSLEDPDFRQVLSMVSERLGRSRRPAYSIMVDARPSDIARFERRGVKVVSLPRSEDSYGATLAAAFYELQEYVRDNIIAASQVTDEKPLQELQLPRGSANKLCFFAIPLELLAQYRSLVFPVIEGVGYVPVTADDVISPGDNINAKIDALIDRSAVMIVEPLTSWTRAEFNVAAARAISAARDGASDRPLKVIVVVERGKTQPPGLGRFQVLYRNQLFSEESEVEFLEGLVNSLRAFSNVSDVTQKSEPKRLLDLGEYRAAVIAALSLLEAWFRQKLEKRGWDEVTRPMSFRQLTNLASEKKIVRARDVTAIEMWSRKRNAAVHTRGEITRADATQVVIGVENIIGKDQ